MQTVRYDTLEEFNVDWVYEAKLSMISLISKSSTRNQKQEAKLSLG